MNVLPRYLKASRVKGKKHEKKTELQELSDQEEDIMIPAMTFTEDTSVVQIKSAAKRKFFEKYDLNEEDIQLFTDQNKRKKIMTERVMNPRTNEEEAMTLALLKESGKQVSGMTIFAAIKKV